MTTIGIVGLGVVGGSVARAFAEVGVSVCGYDRYLDIGKPEDLAGCDVVFLCVPTPSADDGSHDLTEVWSALETIEPHVDRMTVVAIKSTVTPGTCDSLAESFPKVEFVVVPEFLVATNPTESFTRPDRIVIGARSGEAATLIADLLGRVAPTAPIVVLRPTEAELVKLCSNTMLAAKVALANELSDVCRRFGVAWTRIQSVVGLDRRIGPDHLTVTPERGFGGTCLPKDLDGLIAAARQTGHRPSLLEGLAEFNRRIRSEAEPSAAGDQAPIESRLLGSTGMGTRRADA
jgi:UDPglucose 6-dehydrogenase